jgi:hypothetical protein
MRKQKQINKSKPLFDRFLINEFNETVPLKDLVYFEPLNTSQLSEISFLTAEQTLEAIKEHRISADYMDFSIVRIIDFLATLKERILRIFEETGSSKKAEIIPTGRIVSQESRILEQEITRVRNEAIRYEKLNKVMIENEKNYLATKKDLEKQVTELHKIVSEMKRNQEPTLLKEDKDKKIKQLEEEIAMLKINLSSQKTLVTEADPYKTVLARIQLLVWQVNCEIIRGSEGYEIAVKYKGKSFVDWKNTNLDKQILDTLDIVTQILYRQGEAINKFAEECAEQGTSTRDLIAEVESRRNKVLIDITEYENLERAVKDNIAIRSKQILEMQSLRSEYEQKIQKVILHNEFLHKEVNRTTDEVRQLREDMEIKDEKLKYVDPESKKRLFDLEVNEFKKKQFALSEAQQKDLTSMYNEIQLLKIQNQKFANAHKNSDVAVSYSLEEFEKSLIISKFIEKEILHRQNLIKLHSQLAYQREKMTSKFKEKKRIMREEISKKAKYIEALENNINSKKNSKRDSLDLPIEKFKETLHKQVTDSIDHLNEEIFKNPNLKSSQRFFKQGINFENFFSSHVKNLNFNFLFVNYKLLNKNSLRALYIICFYFCYVTGSKMILWFGNEICRLLNNTEFINIPGRINRDLQFWNTQAQWILDETVEINNFKKFNPENYSDFIRHNLYKLIGCCNFAHERVYFA